MGGVGKGVPWISSCRIVMSKCGCKTCSSQGVYQLGLGRRRGMSLNSTDRQSTWYAADDSWLQAARKPAAQFAMLAVAQIRQASGVTVMGCKLVGPGLGIIGIAVRDRSVGIMNPECKVVFRPEASWVNKGVGKCYQRLAGQRATPLQVCLTAHSKLGTEPSTN